MNLDILILTKADDYRGLTLGTGPLRCAKLDACRLEAEEVPDAHFWWARLKERRASDLPKLNYYKALCRRE